MRGGTNAYPVETPLIGSSEERTDAVDCVEEGGRFSVDARFSSWPVPADIPGVASTVPVLVLFSAVAGFSPAASVSVGDFVSSPPAAAADAGVGTGWFCNSAGPAVILVLLCLGTLSFPVSGAVHVHSTSVSQKGDFGGPMISKNIPIANT